MKYIRFGEIPKSGKSLNYMKLTSDQRNDVAWMDHSNLENEIRFVIENTRSWHNVDYDSLWEAGVSVFEESNGLPIIRNAEQARSLKNRIGYAIYIVEGERVGTGDDGEPLLRIETATQINIDSSVLESIIAAFSSLL